jgi:hypothetical protein
MIYMPDEADEVIMDEEERRILRINLYRFEIERRMSLDLDLEHAQHIHKIGSDGADALFHIDQLKSIQNEWAKRGIIR